MVVGVFLLHGQLPVLEPHHVAEHAGCVSLNSPFTALDVLLTVQWRGQSPYGQWPYGEIIYIFVHAIWTFKLSKINKSILYYKYKKKHKVEFLILIYQDSDLDIYSDSRKSADPILNNCLYRGGISFNTTGSLSTSVLWKLSPAKLPFMLGKKYSHFCLVCGKVY